MLNVGCGTGALTTELVQRLGASLVELFIQAGLRQVEEGTLPVSVRHLSFEEWWEPFTLGVGPAGLYLSAQDDNRQAAVQERCREILGRGPLTIQARVWSAKGYVAPS